MLELIILWAYILILNTILGTGALAFTDRLLDGKRSSEEKPAHSFMAVQLAGVVFITVYTEIWSIFGRVYTAAHITLLLAALAYLVITEFVRRDKSRPFTDGKILGSFKKLITILFSWEGVLSIILVLITAYFASRGNQHTDTYIYHAEMIRWYEEYGLVKGLGNLQNHFAYNSASLAYAAIFSMKWLVGQSLHGTNGFFQALLVVWSVRGLIRFKGHRNHLPDAGKVAIIIYAIVNSEYIMSPATDFGAMYMALWIMGLWLENTCYDNGPVASGKEGSLRKDQVKSYALLCVAICCAASYKMAAGMLVAAVIYPAVLLIKGKNHKQIFIYLGLGIAVILPWLVRNLLISGDLLYPMSAFRIAGLDWTIPGDIIEKDNATISVWAKNLYDVELADAPIRQWLPIWWSCKDTYEKMLVVSDIVAIASEILWMIHNIICSVRAQKAGAESAPLEKNNFSAFNPSLAALKLAVLLCLTVWFVQAPFIRYGLAFLLIFPLIEAAQWISDDRLKMGPTAIAAGFLSVAIILSMGIYLNYYTLAETVLAKQNISEPYYVLQMDYIKEEYNTYDMDGVTVYYPASGEDNSYAPIPSTAYIGMAWETELRGDSIEDGFRPKGE